MHGKDQHWGVPVVTTQALNEGEAAKLVWSDREVQDDYIGLICTVQTIAFRHVLGFQNLRDAHVIQELATALKHDWMIVNQKHTSHALTPSPDVATRGIHCQGTPSIVLVAGTRPFRPRAAITFFLML